MFSLFREVIAAWYDPFSSRLGVLVAFTWHFCCCCGMLHYHAHWVFFNCTFFLQGGLTPSIYDFAGFSAIFFGGCFRSHHAPCTLSPLGFLGHVALSALLLPWGSLAHWLAFLISPFPLRLTRPLHGRSPCTLSDCDGRFSPPWTACICSAIIRYRFLEGSCSPFAAGLILWNGDCLLIPLSGALARRWLVLVLLHDRCLIQLPTFSSQPSTIARSVEDWLWRRRRNRQ